MNKEQLAEMLEKYLESTRDFLVDKRRPWPYTSIYDFILRKGKAYLKVDNTPSGRMGKIGMCYFNSYQAVLNDAKLTYCEGYAYNGIIPLQHAWTVDLLGKVIDFTWADGQAYYGVTFTSSYLLKITFSRGTCGPLIDNWEQHFPLLTGEHVYRNGVVDITGGDS